MQFFSRKSVTTAGAHMSHMICRC